MPLTMRFWILLRIFLHIQFAISQPTHPQHFDFFLELAYTYNLPHQANRNIQLDKQLLHCCIFCHGVAMIEQMKNQNKLDNFFPINLSCIMNDLLQHCFKTFGKIQLLIIFSKNNVFISTPSIATKTLRWPTCFHKQSNLGTNNLSLPSIQVHTLHWTWATLPLKPKTHFAQNSFIAHLCWKCLFNS